MVVRDRQVREPREQDGGGQLGRLHERDSLHRRDGHHGPGARSGRRRGALEASRRKRDRSTVTIPVGSDLGPSTGRVFREGNKKRESRRGSPPDSLPTRLNGGSRCPSFGTRRSTARAMGPKTVKAMGTVDRSSKRAPDEVGGGRRESTSRRKKTRPARVLKKRHGRRIPGRSQWRQLPTGDGPASSSGPPTWAQSKRPRRQPQERGDSQTRRERRPRRGAHESKKSRNRSAHTPPNPAEKPQNSRPHPPTSPAPPHPSADPLNQRNLGGQTIRIP